MNDYEQQAEQFLTQFQIEFAIAIAAVNTCPPWADGPRNGACPQCGSTHGNRHRVVFRHKGVGDRCSFEFWGSLNDAQERKLPSAYDVLSCCSSDLNSPDSFEEFCSEFGYTFETKKEERQTRQLFDRCHKQAERLQAFFSEEERAALEAIR